jgi:hypothetical protein
MKNEYQEYRKAFLAGKITAQEWTDYCMNLLEEIMRGKK